MDARPRLGSPSETIRVHGPSRRNSAHANHVRSGPNRASCTFAAAAWFSSVGTGFLSSTILILVGPSPKRDARGGPCHPDPPLPHFAWHVSNSRNAERQ